MYITVNLDCGLLVCNTLLVWYIGGNILEQATASLCRPENGGNKLLYNFCTFTKVTWHRIPDDCNLNTMCL